MTLPIIITIIVIAVLLIVGIIIFIVISKKKKDIAQSEKEVTEKISSSTDNLSLCFGKDNILSIEQRGSRVSITVKDLSLVNKSEIDKNIKSAMYMGNKIVLVIGSLSDEFAKQLKEKLNK